MSNKVLLNGQITEDFTFDHEAYGEKYYKSTISVERESGYVDNIPIIVSERVASPRIDFNGAIRKVVGQMRSYSLNGAKRKLKLYVFVTDIVAEECKPKNFVDIDEAYISKKPIYRTTPFGREITDLLLVVNRRSKQYFIPCICWGRDARFSKDLEVGTKVHIQGRFQSRVYLKDCEQKTAYELSLDLIKVQ